MKKLSNFKQFIKENSSIQHNVYLDNFVNSCVKKGIESKREFENKYPYLVEDANMLFEEFVKIDDLLDFYNEVVEYSDYSPILKNNTKESMRLVKDKVDDVFSLLNNEGGYLQSDKYVTVVNGVVVSLNDDELPTSNRGFLEFFLYNLLDMCGDFYYFMSVFHFDDGLDKETNWNKMKTYYITRPFFDIMYDMYQKIEHYND